MRRERLLQRAENFAALLLCITLSGCGTNAVLSRQLSVRPDAASLSQGDVAIINENAPGQRVDLARYVARGKYTVFEFTSEN